MSTNLNGIRINDQYRYESMLHHQFTPYANSSSHFAERAIYFCTFAVLGNESVALMLKMKLFELCPNLVHSYRLALRVYLRL